MEKRRLGISRERLVLFAVGRVGLYNIFEYISINSDETDSDETELKLTK